VAVLRAAARGRGARGGRHSRGARGRAAAPGRPGARRETTTPPPRPNLRALLELAPARSRRRSGACGASSTPRAWPALLDLLRVRLELPTESSERVGILYEIGHLLQDNLGASPRRRTPTASSARGSRSPAHARCARGPLLPPRRAPRGRPRCTPASGSAAACRSTSSSCVVRSAPSAWAAWPRRRSTTGRRWRRTPRARAPRSRWPDPRAGRRPRRGDRRARAARRGAVPRRRDRSPGRAARAPGRDAPQGRSRGRGGGAAAHRGRRARGATAAAAPVAPRRPTRSSSAGRSGDRGVRAAAVPRLDARRRAAELEYRIGEVHRSSLATRRPPEEHYARGYDIDPRHLPTLRRLVVRYADNRSSPRRAGRVRRAAAARSGSGAPAATCWGRDAGGRRPSTPRRVEPAIIEALHETPETSACSWPSRA